MSVLLTDSTTNLANQSHGPPIDDWRKVPGQWVLARLGRRVLRPGGLELTRHLLDELDVCVDDEVVEFAPDFGSTERMTLERLPGCYNAMVREPSAAEQLRRFLPGPPRRCIQGSADQTGLPRNFATVVYGEAILSMQMPGAQERIVNEAARLLRPGGRYGIHELILVPDDLCPTIREAINRDVSEQIHAGIQLLTIPELRTLMKGCGFVTKWQAVTSIHLLEPRRLIHDEGLLPALRFAARVLGNRSARRRVLAMRGIFRKHEKHLAAVAIVACKR